MTQPALSALRYLPAVINTLRSLAPMVGKINEWLESPPTDEKAVSGEKGEDEHTAILRKLRAQENERLAILREVNHKEEELITLHRQVRENESELISLRKRMADNEEAQTAHLATIGQNLQNLVGLLEEVGNRKARLTEALVSWRQDGYEIESQSDGEAIVRKGRFLRTRRRLTIDEFGAVVVDSP